MVQFFHFTGKCVVDYTEKGWFVQYIDRDPETIKKQEQAKAKEKMDMDDEERTASFIQKQIERAAEQGTSAKETEYTELKRENEEEKGGWIQKVMGCDRKLEAVDIRKFMCILQLYMYMYLPWKAE